MHKDEFDSLRESTPRPENLGFHNVPRPQEPRTLLYGYTTARFTHHVYLKDGEIHLLVYSGTEPSTAAVLHYEHGQVLPIASLIPSKRLYPEACDYETAKYLIAAGYSLPFTTWDRPSPNGRNLTFVGFTREELKE
jgi:hypothetical protein